MVHQSTNKIRRSVVARPYSQLGMGKRDQEQSSLVKSPIKKRRTSRYQMDQAGGGDTEDII